jgi:hypothetical protein
MELWKPMQGKKIETWIVASGRNKKKRKHLQHKVTNSCELQEENKNHLQPTLLIARLLFYFSLFENDITRVSVRTDGQVKARPPRVASMGAQRAIAVVAPQPRYLTTNTQRP